jgi:hypothetical protein
MLVVLPALRSRTTLFAGAASRAAGSRDRQFYAAWTQAEKLVR